MKSLSLQTSFNCSIADCWWDFWHGNLKRNSVCCLVPDVWVIWMLTLSLYPSLVKRLPTSDVNFEPTFEQRLGFRWKRVAWQDLATKTPVMVLSSSTLTV